MNGSRLMEGRTREYREVIAFLVETRGLTFGEAEQLYAGFGTSPRKKIRGQVEQRSVEARRQRHGMPVYSPRNDYV